MKYIRGLQRALAHNSSGLWTRALFTDTFHGELAHIVDTAKSAREGKRLCAIRMSRFIHDFGKGEAEGVTWRREDQV